MWISVTEEKTKFKLLIPIHRYEIMNMGKAEHHPYDKNHLLQYEFNRKSELNPDAVSHIYPSGLFPWTEPPILFLQIFVWMFLLIVV